MGFPEFPEFGILANVYPIKMEIFWKKVEKILVFLQK